jgi:hypothetical protein
LNDENGRTAARKLCLANGASVVSVIYLEDPAHAMFKRDHIELKPIREAFLTKIYAEIPELENALDLNNSLKFFRDIPPRREITPLLAKLAYDIFAHKILCGGFGMHRGKG